MISPVYDLVMTLRLFRRRPRHLLVAWAVLTCGLAPTLFMLGAINTYFLRPLPFPDGDRLVHVKLADQQGGEHLLPLHDYLLLCRQQRSLASVAAYYNGTVNLSGDQQARRLDGAFVTANTFTLLGVRPILGRPFLPADSAAGAEPVLIISHGLWVSRFAADPQVIGRTVRVNGRKASIVGVMPERFHFPYTETVWLPLDLDTGLAGRTESIGLQVFGPLRQGVSLSRARQDLQTVGQELAKLYPETNQGLQAVVKPMAQEYIGAETRLALYTMLAAVLLVLVIACANVANLMLARTLASRRDLAIRAAVGAGRWALGQQVLVECFVLGATAAVVASWLAGWGGRLIAEVLESSNDQVPYWIDFTLFDWRDLAAVAAAALLATVLAGAVPAWRVAQTDIVALLRATGQAAGRPTGRLTRTLVTVEIALACVVLVSAGLLTRSSINLTRVDIGIDTANLLTGRIGLFASDYPQPADRLALCEELMERLAAMPGVKAATASTNLPGTFLTTTHYQAEEQQAPPGEPLPSVSLVSTAANYFDALGVPVLAGRGFTAQDRQGAEPVAVVDELLARRLAADGQAVGTRLRLGKRTGVAEDASWLRVVGVVRSIQQGTVNKPPTPTVYLPLAQNDAHFFFVAVRTTLEAHAFASQLRRAVFAVDPHLPVYWVRTLDEWIARGRFGATLMATLFSLFAVIGLAVAATGLYSVLAYEVEQRTPEIGVRRALGAGWRETLELLAGQGAAQLLIGVGSGLVAAALFAQVLRNVLFGLSSWDPATFLVVVAVIGAVVVLASLVPATRALRVDPVEALRYE